MIALGPQFEISYLGPAYLQLSSSFLPLGAELVLFANTCQFMNVTHPQKRNPHALYN